MSDAERAALEGALAETLAELEGLETREQEALAALEAQVARLRAEVEALAGRREALGLTILEREEKALKGPLQLPDERGGAVGRWFLRGLLVGAYPAGLVLLYPVLHSPGMIVAALALLPGLMVAAVLAGAIKS